MGTDIYVNNDAPEDVNILQKYVFDSFSNGKFAIYAINYIE